MARVSPLAALAALSLILSACKGGCSSAREPEDGPEDREAGSERWKPEKHEKDKDEESEEEAEKAERMKPHPWRIKVVIVGHGIVGSYDRSIWCGDDGTNRGEACGPREWNAPLAGYQPAPSTLTAKAAPG